MTGLELTIAFFVFVGVVSLIALVVVAYWEG